MSTDATGAATLSDQVIEEILGLMGRRRINRAEMARRLGKKEDWVGRRLNGRQPINVEDLRRFAVVLGVSMSESLAEYVVGQLNAAKGRKRLSAMELARRMGKSDDWVGRRLNGDTEVRMHELELFADVLGLPISYFLPESSVGVA